METRQNKQAANNEFIALPIVAIVIDAIVMALAIYFGFTTSTSIFKNILFLIVIVLALVLSIGSIIVNVRNKKTISWIAILLWIVMAIISETVAYNQQVAINKAHNAEVARQAKIKDANNQFKWTFDNYSALQSGDLLTGAGGENYQNIVEKFGEPQAKNRNEANAMQAESMTVTWSNAPDNAPITDVTRTVTLSFIKQSDGSFALATKMQAGLQ